jgi:UDP-N-acetylmuramyl pentapeptide phosphotransferase/UDP-N-acetylglucosamine-1-phosphate transferase
MTDLGVAIFVTTIGLSFLLAVVIGFVRIDPWVRASLVSLGIMGIFALPLSRDLRSTSKRPIGLASLCGRLGFGLSAY